MAGLAGRLATTTLAEAPTIVRLPPRHAPSASAHHSGSARHGPAASCWTIGIARGGVRDVVDDRGGDRPRTTAARRRRRRASSPVTATSVREPPRSPVATTPSTMMNRPMKKKSVGPLDLAQDLARLLPSTSIRITAPSAPSSPARSRAPRAATNPTRVATRTISRPAQQAGIGDHLALIEGQQRCGRARSTVSWRSGRSSRAATRYMATSRRRSTGPC